MRHLQQRFLLEERRRCPQLQVMFAYSFEELHRAADPSVLPPSLGGTGPPHSQEECFRHLVQERRPVRPHAELVFPGAGAAAAGVVVSPMPAVGGPVPQGALPTTAPGAATAAEAAAAGAVG